MKFEISKNKVLLINTIIFVVAFLFLIYRLSSINYYGHEGTTSYFVAIKDYVLYNWWIRFDSSFWIVMLFIIPSFVGVVIYYIFLCTLFIENNKEINIKRLKLFALIYMISTCLFILGDTICIIMFRLDFKYIDFLDKAESIFNKECIKYILYLLVLLFSIYNYIIIKKQVPNNQTKKYNKLYIIAKIILFTSSTIFLLMLLLLIITNI